MAKTHFFSSNGLTSTSANHVANMAKEYVSSIKEELEHIEVVNVDISLIGTSVTNTIQKGVDDEYLKTIKSKLDDISNAYSLIAWLREAIKTRSEMIQEVERMSLDDYCEKFNIERLQAPTKDKYLTEEEYLNTLSIKEMNRYYALETKCSVIGKYIHTSGTYNRINKSFNKATTNPTRIDNGGRDTVIYNYTPSVSKEQLEDVFFHLQDEHRNTQAELNSIKYKMEKAMMEDKQQKDSKYATEVERYRSENDVLMAKFVEYQNQEVKKISSLKIVIPNDLVEIYNTISSLGK